jgi:hypothetical protein
MLDDEAREGRFYRGTFRADKVNAFMQAFGTASHRISAVSATGCHDGFIDWRLIRNRLQATIKDRLFPLVLYCLYPVFPNFGGQ